MGTARILGWTAVGVAALFGGVAGADVVKLRSGDLVEGKAKDLGEVVRVETPAGTVDLPWSSVEVIDRVATPRTVFETKRAAVKEGDTKALFALAIWCERQGLAEEARDLYGKVVAAEPSNEPARRALSQEKVGGEWKKGDDLLRAKGFVHRDGRWMMKAEAESLDREAAAARVLTDEEKRAVANLHSLADADPRVRKYAAEALATAPEPLRRRIWLAGMHHKNAQVREASAKGLALPGDRGVLRTLLQATTLDPSKEVRAAAAESLRAVGDPETVYPLMRALKGSDSAGVRTNAAMALGVLGDRTAVRTLVEQVHVVWGPTARANIQVYNQVSYISDFDVEIAQLAQIGDPIIQQLREGVILDAKVFGAEGWETRVERQAIVESLGKITGKTFGDNPAAWQKWWDTEGRKWAETAAVATEK